jgi:hypothetical protein
VDPVPDPLLLRKSSSAGNRIRTSGSVARDPEDTTLTGGKRLQPNSKAIMPARWQSSQRPLFVRTVWVNGLRHAILSADDPLYQFRSTTGSKSAGRPSSCSSVGTSMSSSSGSDHSCDLQSCIINLQLVLTSNKGQTSNASASPSHRSSSCRPHQDDEPRCVESQDSEENNSVGAASLVRAYRRPQPPCGLPSSSEEEREQESLEDEPFLFSDVESLLPNLQPNPLSERVLQWLNLVGKTSDTVDGIKHIAPAPRFGKGTRKGGPSRRYISVSAPPKPTEDPAGTLYASKRTLQRQRNVDMSTVTLKAEVETYPINIPFQEDPLHVTVKGLKTDRRKRQTFQDARAVIDETAGCGSPVRDDALEPSYHSPTSQQLSSSDSVTQAPLLSSPVQSGATRLQLHIFMPTLGRDRPTLRHQEAADNVSECSSYYSEASS